MEFDKPSLSPTAGPTTLSNEHAVEVIQVALEWKLANLKKIFESTNANTKSKCIKSPLFGKGQWQVYFYANSGNDFCSLYLSAEPTKEERAAGEPWTRDGEFGFTFKIMSADKGITFKSMHAESHAFGDSARNWGWSSMIRRSDCYFNNNIAKNADALFIVCTITYSPCAPSLPPVLEKQLIPKELIAAYASLFNDPEYSDVVFVIQPEKSSTERDSPNSGKRIYASKKILSARSEYFSAMFSGGFAESACDFAEEEDHRSYESEDDWSENDFDSDSEASDDSDTPPHTKAADSDESRRQSIKTSHSKHSSVASFASIQSERPHTPTQPAPTSPSLRPALPGDLSSCSIGGELDTSAVLEATAMESTKQLTKDKRPRAKVVITDASYNTFKALLYYLYSDQVYFTPLTSLYQAAKADALQLGETLPYSDRHEYARQIKPKNANSAVTANAKSVYIVADKYGLQELKARANEHICKSLTPAIIPYEVFGSFSQQYDEIRKVEMAFFLDKWPEVRKTAAMKHCFVLVRKGKLPGFEEVWSRVISNLDFLQGSASSI